MRANNLVKKVLYHFFYHTTYKLYELAIKHAHFSCF